MDPGPVSLSIGTDMVAGNVVSSTPSSGASFNVDNTAPTMTITSSQVLDGYTSDNSSIILTFNSSESTTNFELEIHCFQRFCNFI